MRDLTTVLEVLFSAFVFVVYVLVMSLIVIDLFRDREMRGISKALWILGLLLFPFIAALLYVVTRGRGMSQRSERRRAEASAYVRDLAGPASIDQISRAKTLLDQGVITGDEFAALKRGALAHL
jgi:hypothetical protein